MALRNNAHFCLFFCYCHAPTARHRTVCHAIMTHHTRPFSLNAFTGLHENLANGWSKQQVQPGELLTTSKNGIPPNSEEAFLWLLVDSSRLNEYYGYYY